MTAHGPLYHLPPVLKVLIAVVTWPMLMYLSLAFANWVMRDNRRVVFSAGLIGIAYVYAIVIEREWIFVYMVITSTSVVVIFTSRWRKYGAKPEHPTQFHPFRWIYEKVRRDA